MPRLLQAVRMLGDEGRVRILRLLEREELSVAELQDILGMGQSRISMQLSQLKQAGLVEVRRAGQKSLYRLADAQPLRRRTAARSGTGYRRGGGGRRRPASRSAAPERQAAQLFR